MFDTKVTNRIDRGETLPKRIFLRMTLKERYIYGWARYNYNTESCLGFFTLVFREEESMCIRLSLEKRPPPYSDVLKYESRIFNTYYT